MSNADKRRAASNRAHVAAMQVRAARLASVNVALARAYGDNDAREAWLATNRGRGVSAFDGRSGNVTQSGAALFALKSNPGGSSTRSVLGRTERRGMAFKLVRDRNAPMATSMQRTERENDRFVHETGRQKR